ncbi:MAG: hypothetical protein RTV72_06720 [Candidatus Thorarchaeota archaeon]
MAKIEITYTNQKNEQKQFTFDSYAKLVWLNQSDMTSVDLSPLQLSSKIEELKFITSNLEKLDLQPLTKCRSLRGFSIWKAKKLKDLDLSPLSELQNLENIELSSTSISKLDISPLFQCNNLRNVKIDRKILLVANIKYKKTGVRDLDKLSIGWYGEEKENTKTDVVIDSKLRKKVLGVLKSFSRITISELTQYSGLSPDKTRNLVFELVGEELVVGRFDSSSDSFISTDAALASKKAKSDRLTIQRCVYCGKPLGQVLNPGEEVPCPACDIINIG